MERRVFYLHEWSEGALRGLRPAIDDSQSSHGWPPSREVLATMKIIEVDYLRCEQLESRRFMNV